MILFSFIHANQSRKCGLVCCTVYSLMVLSFRYCLRSAITLAWAASGHAAAAEPLPGHLLKSQQVSVCALTTGCFLSRFVFPFHLCHSEAGGKAISVSLCLSCLAERERPILLRGRLPELLSSLPPSLASSLYPLMDRTILCVCFLYREIPHLTQLTSAHYESAKWDVSWSIVSLSDDELVPGLVTVEASNPTLMDLMEKQEDWGGFSKVVTC